MQLSGQALLSVIMSKRVRTILQYIFFFGLGIFLVWWSIHDLGDKKSQIRDALKNARYWLIVPVFVILILSHYVRALRWRLLIEPIGHQPGIANTFFSVLIGYLANQAFPRAGEVLKCTVLARYEKISADKLIGTIILERLIDAITLLLVIIITLAIQPDLYRQLIDTISSSPTDTETKTISGSFILGAILLIILIALVIWMIRNKKNFADLAGLLEKIAKRVWNGISAIRHLKKRGTFLLYTFLIWGLYLAGGYVGFHALKETSVYGIREALTVLSAGSIGMVATPGGIGAYAFLLEKTMQLYGLQQAIAFAFGWLLWLAQFAVVLIGGFFGFLAIPIYNKRKLSQKIEIIDVKT